MTLVCLLFTHISFLKLFIPQPYGEPRVSEYRSLEVKYGADSTQRWITMSDGEYKIAYALEICSEENKQSDKFNILEVPSGVVFPKEEK